MWGKKEHLKEMGGLSAISEIEEYKYPSFPSFPAKNEGEKEREILIFSYPN